MYESIKGILKEKSPSRAVVETGGIGYRLAIPLSTYTKLPPLETPLQLYLFQVIREDSNTIYAFLDKQERDLFEVLITISGIGPKSALSITGHMEISAFQRAIAAADLKLLSKIPGIGKKTAERLVIEMRDKVKGVNKDLPLSLCSSDSLIGDAVNALLHLGYNALQAQKAVQAILESNKEETDLGKIISLALQKI